MELLSATQALDMLKPLKANGTVAKALAKIREDVPFAETDRVFANDISAIRAQIRSGALLDVLHGSVGELEW